MASNWGVAGLITFGILFVSPKARQQVRYLIDQLGLALEREAERMEAQRRAVWLSEALSRLQLPSPTTATSAIVPKIPALTEPDARWREVVVPPAVILMLGKRDSGKSALAYRQLELFRYRLSPYVVGAPAQAGKLLPEWIGTVPTLEDLPPDSIALVDEAYLHYHARRSMAQESAAMSQQLNLSRQRNQTLIFVSQEARQVDRNIASSASVVVFKEMGMLQPEFDRPELRKLVAEARDALAGVGKDKRRWAYVYSPDADYLGLLESQLPSFWKPSLSRLFAEGPASSSQRTVGKMTPQEKAARAQELRAKGYSYSQIMKDLGVSKATVVNYLKNYPYRP